MVSIARLYETTVAALKQLNGITGTAIQAGQRLTIVKSRGNATN
jgi:LysM repeat protein